MDKFFFVSLLALLIAAHGVAGSMMYDSIGMLGELKSLESLDIEEETEVELSDIPSWRSEHGGKVLVNIDSFGAAGDGESDDTEVTSFIIVVEIYILYIYQGFQMHIIIFTLLFCSRSTFIHLTTLNTYKLFC